MATDSQRPARFKVFWRQRKRPPSILYWPVSVFQYLEWLIEWADYTLKRRALFDLLGRVSQLSILVLVIGYFLGRGDAAENARKQTQYQAWQVVNSALAAGGSGGRVDALQDIHRMGGSLQNVRLTGAVLDSIDLSSTNGRPVSLRGAKLDSVSMVGARLFRANLTRADLGGANLTRANLTDADVDGVRLSLETELQQANLFGVVDPPDGFIQEAIRDGAVCVEDSEEFRAIQFSEREPPDTPQDAAAFERECRIQRLRTVGPEGSRP